MTDFNPDDYAQSVVKEEGTYRVFPIAWTVRESTKDDSKSVGIIYRLGIRQRWHGEAGWSPEWPVGYYVEHQAWIVKRDGEVNKPAVETLGKLGLWNGDFDAFAGPCPMGFFLHADVVAETGGAGQSAPQIRARWLNPDAEVPAQRGSFTPVDEKVLASLRARFQGKTRAMATGVASTGAPSAPSTPPPPVVHHAAPQASQAAPQAPAAQTSPLPSQPPAGAPTGAPKQPQGSPIPGAPGAPGAQAPRGPSPLPTGAPPKREPGEDPNPDDVEMPKW